MACFPKDDESVLKKFLAPKDGGKQAHPKISDLVFGKLMPFFCHQDRLEKESIGFIHAHTHIMPVAMVPEISVYQAPNVVVRAWMDTPGMDSPYWALTWPGGQALARYLLDHPETVRGKKVLDFAAGNGVAAIAAAKAGALEVFAYDIDPVARIAVHVNASHNGVTVKSLHRLKMDRPLTKVDLVVAGDVCAHPIMSFRMLRWLYLCVGAGIPVLLGDPGRAYLPKEGLHERARYEVPVRHVIEDHKSRLTKVYDLSIPGETSA